MQGADQLVQLLLDLLGCLLPCLQEGCMARDGVGASWGSVPGRRGWNSMRSPAPPLPPAASSRRLAISPSDRPSSSTGPMVLEVASRRWGCSWPVRLS